MLRVKICGLTRLVDARTAADAGASYVGAVLVPGSPRTVSPELAAELGGAAERPLVVVIADLGLDDATNVARTAGAAAIQLHGDEAPEWMEELRARGDWELWKAVRVRSRDDVLAAFDRFGPLADLVLLDAWQEDRLGGTGRIFPWDALRSARESAPAGLRIGVAGGLSPVNVAEAVAQLEPDLVDVSSGVESEPGTKDPDLVSAFVQRALEEAGRVEDAGHQPGNRSQTSGS